MTPDTLRPWAERARRILTRRAFLITAAVFLVLFAGYTLAGFLLVPRLIRTYVPRYAEEQLNRRADIGEVRVNPLLFKLEIKGFRLQEIDGRPLLGFDRLFVDFELSSLFRAAWTLADVQLDAPRIDAVLGADGRMNLAELLDTLPPKAEPAPQPAAPPRVLLRHAVVRNGTIAFTDLSHRAAQTAMVQPVNVELHDITTLRERRGPYTIAATLTGGGVIGWDGHVSLVPLASTGRLDLTGFPVATAWRFLQDDVALAEPAGQVDASVRYQFAYRDGATALSVDGVEIGVNGLVLTRRGDTAPLLALDSVAVTGARGDLVARELTVAEIAVGRGRLATVMARDGTLDWQTLVTTPAAAAPPAGAPAAAGTRPWRLTAEKIRVEDVAMAVVDRSRAAPVAVDVGALHLGVSARLESGAGGLTGVAENLTVTLARVALREAAAAGTPAVSLDQIAVEGGRIDLGARQVAVSQVTVRGGATTVVRDASGSLPLLAMLAAAERPAPAPADRSRRASAPAPPAGKPWTVGVGKVQLADHRIAVTDRGVTPAVELGLADLRAAVRDVRPDGKKPWPVEASFRVVQGGRFTARGSVAPDGRAADVAMTITQLALTPAQPYVGKSAAVVLRSGEMSTNGRLTYRAGADRAAVTFSGAADVDQVVVTEAASGEPVLAWKSLHAETIRLGLAPDRLEIDEVRLAGLDGRLVIFQDKSVNLARLMKPGEAPAASPASPAPSALPATAAGREPGPGFPIAIGRVRIDDSAMHFADLSLVLPFATRVHALSGVVAGLGSEGPSRAAVKMEGQVDEFGRLKIDGALSAFEPKTFTDLAVVFRNVPMASMSPYSATFAGRRILAGTMDLDLEYKIDHSALVGENKVVLRQLQLGERVESPGAMRLPLDLAIAILSDADGKIDLAVPVRGNVDRPEFSYGHLIWQALVTVITKVVTSPFRALGGLFGGDAESLEAIAFEAGSDVVLPPERQKLKRVVDVLGKRPRLKLTVHGGYDATLDGEALRSRRVRQELAETLGVKLQPGEDPGPVAFDQAKTQRALEGLLARRGGGKAVDEFQASYEKIAGTKAERVNPVLALVGRGSADRAFYEALFRRLVETAPLPETELTSLARRRGEATVRVLKDGAGAAGTRVDAGDTEAARRAERSAVPTRLELGAVGS